MEFQFIVFEKKFFFCNASALIQPQWYTIKLTEGFKIMTCETVSACFIATHLETWKYMPQILLYELCF